LCLFQSSIVVTVILFGEELLLKLSGAETQPLIHHSAQVLPYGASLKVRANLLESDVNVGQSHLNGFSLKSDRQLRKVLDKPTLTKKPHELA
jgi:hypothetical protein